MCRPDAFKRKDSFLSIRVLRKVTLYSSAKVSHAITCLLASNTTCNRTVMLSMLGGVWSGGVSWYISHFLVSFKVKQLVQQRQICLCDTEHCLVCVL